MLNPHGATVVPCPFQPSRCSWVPSERPPVPHDLWTDASAKVVSWYAGSQVRRMSLPPLGPIYDMFFGEAAQSRSKQDFVLSVPHDQLFSGTRFPSFVAAPLKMVFP